MVRPVLNSCGFSTGSGVGQHSKSKESCKGKERFQQTASVSEKGKDHRSNQQVKLFLFHLGCSEGSRREARGNQTCRACSCICTGGVGTEGQQGSRSTSPLGSEFPKQSGGAWVRNEQTATPQWKHMWGLGQPSWEVGITGRSYVRSPGMTLTGMSWIAPTPFLC